MPFRRLLEVLVIVLQDYQINSLAEFDEGKFAEMQVY